MKKSRMTRIAPAATRPPSCVRTPIESFTAVREPLAPIGKPWVSPAATLAAPIANTSCSARTCCPCLPANDRAVRISSAKLTRKIPTAAVTSSSASPPPGVGRARSGMPLGTLPTTARPRSSRSSHQEIPIPPTTTSSAAGMRGAT